MTAAISEPTTHGADCACTRCVGFQPGNTLAARSGFWASPLLRDDDRAEVEEIADTVRAALPIYEAGFELAVEQLAVRLWRQRRAYADLSAHGVLRDGRPAPVLADLSKVENAIQRDLDALGLTPLSRARLGLDLARTEDSIQSLIEQGRAIMERREHELEPTGG
jgi:hypothetical protein